MQLEIGKRYKTRCGAITTIRGYSNQNRMFYGDIGSGPTAMRIEWNHDGSMTNGLHGNYDIIGRAEPELMFSFKRPGPIHSFTVSESDLREAIQDARLYPHSMIPPDIIVLADAAERMIEQAKYIAEGKAKPLKSNEPIRPQLAALLESVGLDPDRYLVDRPSNSPFNYGLEKKPMCFDDPKSNAKSVAEDAAFHLSRMIKDDLGVTISPILLRLWLNERWADVAKLAHKIHGG